jgi:hypothetical protein
VSEGEADLRAILETLDPNARLAFRRVLIHDQGDRDAISSDLLRYREYVFVGSVSTIYCSAACQEIERREREAERKRRRRREAGAALRSVG